MQALVALRVPIDEELLHRLARLAPGARDWSEALQWVLDAFETLTEDVPRASMSSQRPAPPLPAVPPTLRPAS